MGTSEAHTAVHEKPSQHQTRGPGTLGSPSVGDVATADRRQAGALLIAGERLALTVSEAGALLGISRALAYELVARGELPSIRLGRRLVVPKVALLEMLGLSPRRTA